ncbi:PREDICTED: atrial natriuretic peptide receptor 2-like [Gekko japonicus]|uniref:Atrial natriuretic peptide receptor 2-like n=1 Tax=Gekko japonicus TaxID=146911 RepID=A0ABM1K3U6_GEKJA|nr:PREDICTED: atrial natriuretic peptide receptor 2-like [Gekko japonicus]
MAALPPLLLLLGALAALLAAPCTARPAAANASAAPSGVEVRLGVLLPERNLHYPWAWPRVGPALNLALEALQPQLRHAGLALRTAFASTEKEGDSFYCDPDAALFQATKLKHSHDPDVLLGLGCAHTSYRVAPLAQHWRLPLLRAGLYRRHDDLSSKPVYAGPAEPDPRAFGAQPDPRAFGAQLFRHFNWTFRPILVYSPESDWKYHASLLRFGQHLEDTPGYLVGLLQYQQPGSEAVRIVQATARVVYILGPLEMLLEFMHLAQAQNMTNGDYVFFYLDILGESLRAEGHREAAKPWQSKESPDAGDLQEAFQTVLVIAYHGLQTPKFQRFQSQLILRAQRDFGVALNDSLGTLVAGCFHDVLLLYLRALNETLHEGGTKRDTSRILEKMRGLKIQGVTGTVSINSDNDRGMDFDLWAMKDVESGEYQVVAHYVGSEKRINWTGPIHWKKGGPPLDNPPCVFNMDDPSCGTGVPYAIPRAPSHPHPAAGSGGSGLRGRSPLSRDVLCSSSHELLADWSREPIYGQSVQPFRRISGLAVPGKFLHIQTV